MYYVTWGILSVLIRTLGGLLWTRYSKLLQVTFGLGQDWPAYWCSINLFLVQVRLRKKYYASQLQADWGSNSWPPDHVSTFHVTGMPLTTRPSVIWHVRRVFYIRRKQMDYTPWIWFSIDSSNQPHYTWITNITPCCFSPLGRPFVISTTYQNYSPKWYRYYQVTQKF